MKFRTGGQTGVDRAALDALVNYRREIGGWCPKGRRAEDGIIPERYPLQELDSESYADRTLANVRDSDATLIIHFGPLEGGTKLTQQFCREAKKPCLEIDGGASSYAEGSIILERFLGAHAINELNIAGPRASESPQAYEYTYAFLEEWLTHGPPVIAK